MKAKTAIGTLFSDAELSTGLKVEVVKFLRRYSSARRPITHYSCIGKSTAVLVQLLEALGLQQGKDFTVAKSKLDPEFNQIRWAGPSSKTPHVLNALARMMSGYPGLCNALYVGITGKKDVSDLVGKAFVDIDGTSTSGDPDANHFTKVLAKRTSTIVKAVLGACRNGPGNDSSGIWSVPNAKLALPLAEEFLSRHFEPSGAPKSGDAPYLLPLSILEIYVKMTFSVNDTPRLLQDRNSLLFKTTDRAIDLFRLLNINDNLPWESCLQAPLSYLWHDDKTASGKPNPLRGFLFRGVGTLDKATVRNKVGVFVGGNAELIHDKDADDNVTPAIGTHNLRDFWQYVINTYSLAYGCQAGLSCESRIGISPEVPAWGGLTPKSLASPRVLGHYTEWVSHEGGPKPETGIVMAEYALFLADGRTHVMDSAFINADCFIMSTRRFNVVPVVDESATPNFDATHLTKEELGWEWFAMTHMGEAAGGTKQDEISCTRRQIAELRASGRAPLSGPETAMKNTIAATMQRFKAWISQPEDKLTKMVAGLSSYYGNSELLNPTTTEHGDNRYTPVSAMFNGACLYLRRAWVSRHDAEGSSSFVALPLAPKPGGNDNLIVTNVYSGMYTDLSPELGSDKDDGTVFPSLAYDAAEAPLTGVNGTRGLEAVLDGHANTEARRAGLSRLLERMASGSLEQVRFAHRKVKTRPRVAVYIMETNLKAQEYMEGVNISELEKDLGTLFLQTILMNNTDPMCMFDSSAVDDTNRKVAGHNHSAMCTEAGVNWSLMMKNGSFALPTGIYDPDNCRWSTGRMNVSAAEDSHGRLVLVFEVCSDLLTYARLLFRFTCAYPLETAAVKKQLFVGYSDWDLPLGPGEWGSMDKAADVIKRHCTKCCTDFDGTANTGAVSGDCGPLFRYPLRSLEGEAAPPHDWYCGTAFLTVSRNMIHTVSGSSGPFSDDSDDDCGDSSF